MERKPSAAAAFAGLTATGALAQPVRSQDAPRALRARQDRRERPTPAHPYRGAARPNPSPTLQKRSKPISSSSARRQRRARRRKLHRRARRREGQCNREGRRYRDGARGHRCAQLEPRTRSLRRPRQAHEPCQHDAVRAMRTCSCTRPGREKSGEMIEWMKETLEPKGMLFPFEYSPLRPMSPRGVPGHATTPARRVQPRRALQLRRLYALEMMREVFMELGGEILFTFRPPSSSSRTIRAKSPRHRHFEGSKCCPGEREQGRHHLHWRLRGQRGNAQGLCLSYRSTAYSATA